MSTPHPLVGRRVTYTRDKDQGRVLAAQAVIDNDNDMAWSLLVEWGDGSIGWGEANHFTFDNPSIKPRGPKRPAGKADAP